MFRVIIFWGIFSSSSFAFASPRPEFDPSRTRVQYDQYFQIEDSGTTVPQVAFRIENSMPLKPVSLGEDLLKWAHKNLSWPEPRKPYDRLIQFGAWISDPSDHPCLNTREKVLIRDSERTVDLGANGCTVKSGEWLDPYGGKTFHKPTDMQIDHLVSLKNAYINGASKWNPQTRCAYANFLANSFHLVSASGHENQSKGDSDPSRWLPPNTDFRCTYLKNWLSVKLIWGLVMSDQEAKAIKQAITDNNCDLRKFRMSKAELAKQRQAISTALDLCQ